MRFRLTFEILWMLRLRLQERCLVTELELVMSWSGDGSSVSRSAVCMRYPQGGGLTAQRRALREKVRLEAAGRFATGQDNAAIARELCVHVRSVQRWRATWDAAGDAALRSKGPASLPALSDQLFAALEAELEKGPAAHGWPDQRWTLSRI